MKERCKACDLNLSDQSVYALGDDRWHIDCFKCSVCKKQLTEEMNMLVLKDGMIICSDCSFSCAMCSRKITDVAVLTNDKAFCASCFVCKKCKNKIDDLHYARTSQGIFCMSCHQILLDHKRRRRKQQALAQNSSPSVSTASNTPAASPSPVTNGQLKHLPTSHSKARDNDLTLSDETQHESNWIKEGPPVIEVPQIKETSSVQQVAPVKETIITESLTVSNPSKLSITTQMSQISREVSHQSFSSVSESNINSATAIADLSSLKPPVSNSSPESATYSQYSQSGSPMDSVSGKSDISNLSESTNLEPSDSMEPLTVNNKQKATLEIHEKVQKFDNKGTSKNSLVSEKSEILEQSDRSENSKYMKDPERGDRSVNFPSAVTFESSQRPQSSNKLDDPFVRNEKTDESAHIPTPVHHSQPSRSPREGRSRSGSQVSQKSQKSHISQVSMSQNSLTSQMSHSNSASSVNKVPRKKLAPSAFQDEDFIDEPQTPSSTSSAGVVNIATTASVAIPQRSLLRPHSPERQGNHRKTNSQNSNTSTPQQPSKSPFSRLLRKRSQNDSPIPLISSPTNFHKHKGNDTLQESTSLEDLEPSEITSIGSGINTNINGASSNGSNLSSSIHSANATLNSLRLEIVKLHDEQKNLLKRNMQLLELNQDLEKQIADKMAQHPNLEKPYVTVLEPKENNPLKSTKNWFFRKKETSTSIAPITSPLSASANYMMNDSANMSHLIPSNPLSNSGSSISHGFGFVGNSLGNRGSNDHGSHHSSNHGSLNNLSSHHGHNDALKPHSNSVNGLNSLNQAEIFQAHSLVTLGTNEAAPLFVNRRFQEVEKRGLDVVGIYRKPGSKPQVDLLLKHFSSEGDISSGEQLMNSAEIQTITSAVKQYLRKLQNPVIPFDVYEAYIAAGNSRNVEVLKRAVSQLPQVHLATLKVCIAHLSMVASHENVNLMNKHNLATVFAPTLSRDENGDREVPDMHAREDATLLLLENASILDSM